MISYLIVDFSKSIGGAIVMAKCAICEKAVSHGNKISIARSHVSRRSVKAVVDGETKTIQVCSKCLRSGKVNRA